MTVVQKLRYKYVNLDLEYQIINNKKHKNPSFL